MAIMNSSNAILANAPGFNTYVELYKDIHENGEIGAALKRSFYDPNTGLRTGKVAGAVFGGLLAADLALGGIRGAMTDSNGSFDMPGIPFI